MHVNPQWLSVEEVASHLGVSREALYKWIRRKGLPGHKVGRLWKFDRVEVDNWVRGGAHAATPEPESDNG